MIIIATRIFLNKFFRIKFVIKQGSTFDEGIYRFPEKSLNPSVQAKVKDIQTQVWNEAKILIWKIIYIVTC
jgi:hypothetical protein